MSTEQLAQGIRAFEEFLNDRRDAPVSEVFHDVVAKVSALVTAHEAEKAQGGPRKDEELHDASVTYRDGMGEPYNCLAAGPTATDLALWQAMNEAEKYGLRTDDKLIRKALNAEGYFLVRSMKKPGTCDHLLAASLAAPVAVPLTDEELRNALRQCPQDVVENLRVRWLYATDFARSIERTLAARWGIKLEGGQG